jgi:dUTP pyrophosphatase
VPLNIAVQVPVDHWVLVSARSSLHKKGLMVANGIGVGDYDYRGDNDEYQAVLWNFTDKPVTVKRGERIAQMVILKRDRVEFEEKAQFSAKDRGGFGSTG